MTSFIEQIFTKVFGDNIVLATILIAIVPIIELKGAIPFSVSRAVWGSLALGKWQAFLFAGIGSCLVVPVLALVYLPMINWLKRTKLFKKLALKIENRINSKKQKVETHAWKAGKMQTESGEEFRRLNESDLGPCSQNTENTSPSDVVKSDENAQNNLKRPFNKVFFIKLVSVFLFVCVPLPLTGVWTGTCVAVALGLGFWCSCLTVILGNIVSGLIVTLLTGAFGQDTIILFYILLVLIVVLFIVSLVVNSIKSGKNSSE